MHRVACALLVTSSLALSSCSRSGATPEQKCNDLATVLCRKVIQCSPGNPVYPSEADCVAKQIRQSNCASWKLPEGCTFDTSPLDRCISEVGNLSCGEASTGQLPSSCQSAFARPPICTGSGILCSDYSSSSGNGGCRTSRTGCIDGNSYELTCESGACSCKVNGMVTLPAMGVTTCSSYNVVLNEACGWNIVDYGGNKQPPDMSVVDLRPPADLTPPPDLAPVCMIGGQAYGRGAVDPSNPCQSCQPSASTTDWSPTPLATGLFNLVGIALDATSVYWVRGTNIGQVSKMPLGGGNITVLAEGPPNTNSLTLDGSNVYFTTAGAGLDAGTVMKVGLGGGATTQYASAQAYPMGIAVDPTSVYWTNSSSPGALMKAPIGGGTPTALASAQGYPAGVVVDATSVYWVNEGNGNPNTGQVMKVARGGGTPVMLAMSQNFPRDAAIDGTSVYWVNRGTPANNYSDGTVMKVALGGGTPVMLASGQASPLAITIDGTSVYWINNPGGAGNTGSVMKVALGGGTPTVLATGQDPSDLAVNSSCVYWTTHNGNLMRGRK